MDDKNELKPGATEASAPMTPASTEAKIEIVLTNGRRIGVPALVDPAALARLLPVVERA
jgi:transposase